MFWAVTEVGGANFGDARLAQRLVHLLPQCFDRFPRSFTVFERVPSVSSRTLLSYRPTLANSTMSHSVSARPILRSA